ncbi:uncharacterized protein E0L32_007546 [Thyridium curvatum]|uniref:DUF6923 domain-containing protein n=1 Tax=Thyridium curvatum TaxID=1093900 RepID=A0A507B3C8_9PEZI|nr:uncharacterized protein E0L32_007546 [Thyridium curvatum]TPX11809.1 hypothetical protein E0L32_007546 [Thyridium curvatum]
MHLMALLGPLAFAELLRTVKADDCMGLCPDGKHLIKVQPVVIAYPEKGLASRTAIASTETIPCDEYVTVTTPGDKATTYTIPPSGTVPGTVIIETPSPTPSPGWTTITTPGPVATTHTIPPSGTNPGTVIIETPTSSPEPTSPEPTSSKPSSPEPTTSESTSMEPTSTDPASSEPLESPTTTAPTSTPRLPITSLPTFSNTSSPPAPESWTTYTTEGPTPTTHTIPPEGTTPGTVIIETPPAESWTTYTTEGPTPTTITKPPEGTNPGTVIIETPPPGSWVTLTRPGPDFLTTTEVTPVGTTPGTVVVETPSWTTYTTEGPTPTTHSIPPEETNPGTVIIETPPPESWVTVTRPGPEFLTTTEATPIGTTPGTVVIETPSWTTYTTEGPTPTTKTVPPEGTNPGTVIIETPPPETSPAETSPSESSPAETSTAETSPAESWTTYTTEGPTPTTETISPSGTNPGTVIIETPPATTFTCDKYAYLIQWTSLFRVDIKTGEVEVVNRDVNTDSRINAIGYNTLDNYIYGMDAATHNLLRIPPNGKATVVATRVATNLDRPYVGDVDSDGFYWVSNGSDGLWVKIDLRPGTSTYGQVVDSGNSPVSGGYIVGDWTYVPSAGPYNFAIGTNHDTGTMALLRWSHGTHRWTTIRTYTISDYPKGPEGGFGGIWAQNNGTVYAIDNPTGYIIAFDVDGLSEPRLVSEAAPSPGNDGARCVSNLDAES